MDNARRKLGILRKNQKDVTEIESMGMEMRNAFDGLLSRLDVV